MHIMLRPAPSARAPAAPMADATLTFSRPDGGRLHLGPRALEVLLRHRQLGPRDAEAGGVLLGRYLLGSPDVVVDRVTEPMLGDRRTPSSFDRHHAGHQAAIDEAWMSSGGRTAWLGEWHTHPEPVPTPSPADRRDWHRRLRRDVFDEVLFFLVVGTGTVAVWEGTPPRHVRPLSPLAVPCPPFLPSHA